ncbi:MAG: hypothetical protein GKS00_24615 [Alphaproteobacteria bacterium]|nr:hypothetical protein [Alphaproteobacteria bacterium]
MVVKNFKYKNTRIVSSIACFFYMAVFVSSPGTLFAQEKALNIVSTFYTSSWNPITYDSYPAQILTHFTTQRLFEKRCFIEKGARGVEFENICLQEGEQPKDGQLVLRFTDRCSNLSGTDISYTIDQIGKAGSKNSYSHYRMVIDEDDGNQIQITQPASVSIAKAKEILSFPLLRYPEGADQEFYKLSLSDGSRTAESVDTLTYNAATAGMFQLNALDNGTYAKLVRRMAKTEKNEISSVNFRYNDTRSVLVTGLSDSSKAPDIVLSLPRGLLSTLPEVSVRDRYKVVKNDDALTGFTYFGFNFSPELDREKTDMFDNIQFRELFAKSLWTVPKIRERYIGYSGEGGNVTFTGGSFEVFGGFDTNISDYTAPERVAEIAAEVRQFMDVQPNSLTLKVLVSHAIASLFDENELERMKESLEEKWKSSDKDIGFNFRFLRPGSAKDYDNIIKQGEFDMVFDTFTFGSNRLRYMSFLDPESSLNFLQINLDEFKRLENEDCAGIDLHDKGLSCLMSRQVEGKVEFLRRVARAWPVAVIGIFEQVDLISKALKPLNTGGDSECANTSGSVAAPYFGISNWVKN